jgi:hypothetical protein
MVKDRLREGLATSMRTKIGGETERFIDGQVSLDVEQRSTRSLLFREHVSTATGQDTIDTTHGLLGNLYFNKVHRLEKSGISQ